MNALNYDEIVTLKKDDETKEIKPEEMEITTPKKEDETTENK